MLSPSVDNLVAQLTRLPGIGSRTAQRLAFHLLATPKDEALALAHAIEEVKERVRFCSECGNLTEEELCAICLDARRDRTRRLRRRATRRRDLARAHARVPRPLPRPRRLALAARRRRARAPADRRAAAPRRATARSREVVLATNPNMTGEATAAYLADRLRDRATRDSARERASGRRRPRVRRRGHARPRARRPPRDLAYFRSFARSVLLRERRLHVDGGRSSRFPGAEPVGLRVRRFSIFCGRFSCRSPGPQLDSPRWPRPTYEAVPGGRRRRRGAASAARS